MGAKTVAVGLFVLAIAFLLSTVRISWMTLITQPHLLPFAFLLYLMRPFLWLMCILLYIFSAILIIFGATKNPLARLILTLGAVLFIILFIILFIFRIQIPLLITP